MPEEQVVCNLRDVRKHNGITQEQLAQEVGVTQQTISAFEKGEAEPSIKTALKIAAALGVAVFLIWALSDKEKGG